MIKPVYYKDLGNSDFGWLNAHYHFSFSNYHNPERMGFGKLRVINDDIIAAGRGFPPHSHDNMEIITFVRQGAITHKDSVGNEGKTAAGDIQVMSAGSGITHSEYNREDIETRLYQIWIEPRERDVEPAWKTVALPKEPVKSALPLLVSGDGTAPLQIHADATIHGGKINTGDQIVHNIDGNAYLLVSDGTVKIGDFELSRGDAAEITDQSDIQINALETSEILIITNI